MRGEMGWQAHTLPLEPKGVTLSVESPTAPSQRIREKQGVQVIKESPYSQARIRGFARPGRGPGNPVTRSRSRKLAPPASHGRPDGSKVTCLIVKNTQDPVPLLRTFTSLSPNLGRDGPPGNENHARRSLYSGTSLDPFAAPASEAKLMARRPVVRVRPRHLLNEEPRLRGPRFFSFGLITC